jgi:hypothetical protein
VGRDLPLETAAQHDASPVPAPHLDRLDRLPLPCGRIAESEDDELGGAKELVVAEPGLVAGAARGHGDESVPTLGIPDDATDHPAVASCSASRAHHDDDIDGVGAHGAWLYHSNRRRNPRASARDESASCCDA